jgi:hypothetical protein
MPPQALNDWSPWMKALSMAGSMGMDGDASQQPMEIPAEITAQATPAQPSTSTPPTHRIADDNAGGLMKTSPQGQQGPSDQSGFYSGANYHINDPSRLPLEQQIGADKSELYRMNNPAKTSLLQRMIGMAQGGMAGFGGTGGEVMALRDRVEARKQQEREGLRNQIEQSTRQLSQEAITTERMKEQERLRAMANETLMNRVMLQQQGAGERNAAQIQGRAQLQEDKPTPTPKPTFEEQQYQEWANTQKAAGKPSDRMTFDKLRHSQDRVQRPPNEREEWERDHPGEPIENYWKAKGVAGAEAKAEGAQKTKLDTMGASVKFAQDYLDNGMFTGPKDEALQEKFFDLARPEKGFRMTDAQIQMLRNSRSWMGSLEGKARHALTGTWFSDTQRGQIVSAMNDIYKANQGGGETRPRPSNVPSNYQYNAKGPKGPGWYKP